MKLLKYLNIACIRVEPRPAYLRIVCVNDRDPVACNARRPLLGQFPEQRQGNDALAAARPARHDDDLLAVASAGSLHGVQHEFVCHPLLLQQREVVPALQLVRSMSEEQVAGSNRAGQKTVRGAGARLRCQVGAEELLELTPSLLREDSAVLGGWELEQAHNLVVKSVVQVRGTAHRLGLVMECAEEIDEVLAVTRHLKAGVQPRPQYAFDGHEVRRLVVQGGGTPLLELDDDVRVAAGARVHAGQDGVHTFAGQRQLVLGENLDLAKSGVHEILREDRQAPLPGPPLCWTNAVAAHSQLLGDPVGKAAVPCVLEYTSSRRTEYRHLRVAPGQHE